MERLVDKNEKKCMQENEKKAYDRKKFGLNKYDSALAFAFGCFIAPVCMVLVISVVIGLIAEIANYDIEAFLDFKVVKAVTLTATALGFLSYVLFVVIRRKKQGTLKFCFNFQKLNLKTTLIVIALSVLFLFGTSYFVNSTNEFYSFIGYHKLNELPLEMTNGWELLLGIFVLALLPALSEELLVRGVILGGLINRAKNEKGRIIAVVVSALIFALVHQSLLQFVYPLAMGLLFGFVYLYTCNLWYSIIMHFTSNAIVVVSTYLSLSSVPNIDLTYVLLSILLLIVTIVVAYFLIKLIKRLNKSMNSYIDSVRADNEIEEIQKKDIQYVKFVNSEGIIERKKIDYNRKEKVGQLIMLVAFLYAVTLFVIDFINNI